MGKFYYSYSQKTELRTHMSRLIWTRQINFEPGGRYQKTKKASKIGFVA